MNQFSKKLLAWHDQHGRHHLPWQQNKSAYKVWVSEIMLQQTQVATVIDYFKRFMQRFPNIKQLAEADINEVLQLWAGLGYYARARNLHRAAIIIHLEHQGQFPKTLEQLQTLPGIGRSTAAAILSLAYEISAPILDGNVKRVFARHFEIKGYPNDSKVNKHFWSCVEKEMPTTRPGAYNQALMDMGSMICTRTKPRCDICPVKTSCLARKNNCITALPTPKPKKNRPEKQVFFLLIQNKQQQTLLYKRPHKGIWGGLWSLPECHRLEDIHAVLAKYFATNHSHQQKLSPFHHDFTHYRLYIQPVLISLTHYQQHAHSADEWHWHDPHKIKPIGLPAPVTKLLGISGQAAA
ncbi:MAG: A/G-specific adenine glycosylase [Gammaproteobacteria bacterium RIFCSPHIGHO2_12_FULL_41_15]|nr:MAG: A/G-specific adenine glycosylase [Gammaproteobacteria bacterium RIFCSPHIGHO2_12_FULL_41_15]